MKDTTVAGRYARALLIVTEKRGETEKALADLRSLWEAVQPGTRVAHFLATPQVLLSDKRRALEKTLAGRCVPSVVLFIDLLLRKKRLTELGQVVREFEALVERAQGVERAHVASAVALTESEKRDLLKALEHLTGKKVKMDTALEPDLVGGALVRIGDRVFDRTVRMMLRRIHEQLSEAGV
jgi:F-type H+-transporting ATPase subunit delta